MSIRRKNRKQAILDEAAILFRTKGYSATSMKEIAEKVGIEAASLYNHINAKQELLKELLSMIAVLFTRGMQDIYSADLPPRKKLEHLVGLHVRLTLDYPDAIALLAGEWVHLDEQSLAIYLSQRQQYEKQFIEIIEACIAEGELAVIDPQIALFCILSTLHSLHSWHRKHLDQNPLELEEAMIRCLIDGLNK